MMILMTHTQCVLMVAQLDGWWYDRGRHLANANIIIMWASIDWRHNFYVGPRQVPSLCELNLLSRVTAGRMHFHHNSLHSKWSLRKQARWSMFWSQLIRYKSYSNRGEPRSNDNKLQLDTSVYRYIRINQSYVMGGKPSQIVSD